MNKEFKISLGELRGNFMAEKRRQAFLNKYNQEPEFNKHHEQHIHSKSDFIKACELISTEELYKEFNNFINKLMNEL